MCQELQLEFTPLMGALEEPWRAFCGCRRGAGIRLTYLESNYLTVSCHLKACTTPNLVLLLCQSRDFFQLEIDLKSIFI